ncbi:TetR/AcrR family transcriptional regulator [Lapillicoccus sp.]|uniref:TetR/AcrR family transcriptional regulator n=1 Tax=Lapillicoccus sp. TaxID=1909287 RepID=UPI003267BCBC
MRSPDAATPRARQRARTTVELLDAALEQMTQDGVAGLNLSEVAARVGLAQPSVYRYFPSKTAVYDALFARGMTAHRDLVYAVVASTPPGWAAVEAAVKATVAFVGQYPTLADLMFRRTVPGFTPSAKAYAPSVEAMQIIRQALVDAVAVGDLAPEAASPEGIELLVTLAAGVMSQQSANHADGGEARLLPVVLEMYQHRYRARKNEPR